MTVRSVPAGFAPLLQLLELEQPRVLTTSQLGDLSQQAGLGMPVDVVVRRLRERGWLLPLATKGVWEFAPADRAGPFGSGDPLIELRAVLARDPDAHYAVAAESAAYLLGYATRRPEPECVGAPPSVRPLKALGSCRIVRWEPATPVVARDGLPVWSPAMLIAFMASRPSAYRDWPNVGEWLSQAAAEIEVDDLLRELDGRSAGAWARAEYLLDSGGAAGSAAALELRAPKGSGPYYLGDRSRPGRYDGRYDVMDSSGMQVGECAAERIAEYVPRASSRTVPEDIDRRALLRLPAAERKSILLSQAEEFAEQYADSLDHEWLGADLGDQDDIDE